MLPTTIAAARPGRPRLGVSVVGMTVVAGGATIPGSGVAAIGPGPGTLLLVHRKHRWLPWCRRHPVPRFERRANERTTHGPLIGNGRFRRWLGCSRRLVRRLGPGFGFTRRVSDVIALAHWIDMTLEVVITTTGVFTNTVFQVGRESSPRELGTDQLPKSRRQEWNRERVEG